APDSIYPTSSANNGPNHTLDSRLYMGACVDDEADGQSSFNAKGDDTTNALNTTEGSCLLTGHDEDGLMPPVFIDGQSNPQLIVSTVNTTGSSATLACWVDYNGDGQFDNTTERGVVTVANGATSVMISMPNVPANASTTSGGGSYLRCRLASDPTQVQTFTGTADSGEVEDYTVEINAEPVYDFGDAPDSYGTTPGSNGAGHLVVPGLKIGATLDEEIRGEGTGSADGDGADEDGVVIPEVVDNAALSLAVTVSNVTGQDANLVCWIDYNGDGVFATDGSESGVASVVDGSNNAQVAVAMPDVPVNASTATNGTAYIRCRLTTAALTAANPTGLVADGEVEDYRVTIEAVPVCSIDTPVTSATCDDNGTPSDATDDLFGYTINASGSNTGASYSISGGDSQAGLLYGQVSGAFSGFPISAGSLTLTLTDVADNSCTLANVSIAAPATCSNSAPPANFDFGDAPDSYGTSETGHRVVSGLQLGAALDNEPAGQDGGTATGDGPDEDGVIIPALI
ncbi:MAG: hypothetical protein KAG66_20095, partial [Methylococcales bacterium]|nr:hypothetical protein [Methylococcales bacterium]